MITQLNPPLPLETVKGPGWAHFVIDYGPESALLWVVFLDADGACLVQVPNLEVRMCFNWMLGGAKKETNRDRLVRFHGTLRHSAFTRRWRIASGRGDLSFLSDVTSAGG